MKVTKKQEEKNIVELEITVSSDEFEAAVEKAYRKNVKNIALPGFRKGKAPRKIIEKTYGAEVFYEDAADFCLQDTYPKAVEDENIEPVARPDIEVKEIGEGKDFVYVAKVTVKPEVVLGKYKGVKIKKIEHAVTDEDIDKEIDNMKERAARFIDVTDAPAADGDVAVIDFEGSIDGVPFDGGKAENHNLTLGSNQFIPGFEDQIVGKNIGDEFDVNVTFPEEYHAEELKGKPAVFKVKLNGLKRKEYPEVDDEFAKDVSEFDTLEELKNATKERLVKIAENRVKNETQDAVIDCILDKTEIDVPDVMVENNIDGYIREMEYKIGAQMPGITFEQYLGYMGQNITEFRDSLKDKALKDVKIELMLEAIAKAENIEVSDEDVEAEYKAIAEMYKMEEDKVRSLVSPEQIKMDKTPSKVVEFLVENAKIS